MVVRMPDTSSECLASLRREPIPLCSEELGIALLWNAKAACTFAIKWLYWQEGLLEEAQAYAPWPHQYRQYVYCQRPHHAECLGRIPRMGPRVIKVVRNPFDRAVGAYLSYCNQAARRTRTRHDLLARAVVRRVRGRDHLPSPDETDPQHARLLRSIGRQLGREVGNGGLFTFREFVGFLETLEIDTADMHLRSQVHPCERSGALDGISLVRVEEADREIPRLEEELGLRHADLVSLRRSRHHSERTEAASFAADSRFGDTLGTPVPASRWFYDQSLVERVGQLYREDIERYGYEPLV